MLLLKNLLCIGLVLGIASLSANELPTIIVNNEVAEHKISNRKLLRIYSMQQKRWSDGQRIHVFTLPLLNQTHQQFVKQILKSQPYQLERHWKRLLFSGIGNTPEQLESVQVMLDTIKKTPGAIGYVPTIHDNAQVKVLEVK